MASSSAILVEVLASSYVRILKNVGISLVSSLRRSLVAAAPRFCAGGGLQCVLDIIGLFVSFAYPSNLLSLLMSWILITAYRHPLNTSYQAVSYAAMRLAPIISEPCAWLGSVINYYPVFAVGVALIEFIIFFGILVRLSQLSLHENV
jgi:hypothetical protein